MKGLDHEQQTLVEQHVAWATGSPIHRFRRAWGQDQDELESAALLGLVRAASTFSGHHGASFKTWAHLKIQSCIRDAMRDRMRSSGFVRARGAQRNEGHRMFPKALMVQWPMEPSGDPMDIEAPTVDLDTKIDNERALEHAVDVAGSERNRAVVRDYANGHTMNEVSEAHGINESRVSQIIGAAVDRTKDAIDSGEFGAGIKARRDRIVAAIRTHGALFAYRLSELLPDIKKSTITNDLYALSHKGIVQNSDDGWRLGSGKPKRQVVTSPVRVAAPVAALPKPQPVATAVSYAAVIADLENKRSKLDAAITALKALAG